jgi:hypothetical protein
MQACNVNIVLLRKVTLFRCSNHLTNILQNNMKITVVLITKFYKTNNDLKLKPFES